MVKHPRQGISCYAALRPVARKQKYQIRNQDSHGHALVLGVGLGLERQQTRTPFTWGREKETGYQRTAKNSKWSMVEEHKSLELTFHHFTKFVYVCLGLWTPKKICLRYSSIFLRKYSGQRKRESLSEHYYFHRTDDPIMAADRLKSF